MNIILFSHCSQLSILWFFSMYLASGYGRIRRMCGSPARSLTQQTVPQGRAAVAPSLHHCWRRAAIAPYSPLPVRRRFNLLPRVHEHHVVQQLSTRSHKW